MQTDGDGYYLINAIIKSLENDYGIIKHQNEVIDNIIEELHNNSDQYVNYFHGTKREMLRQAKQYGEKASDVYCGQIVDIITCAAANCFGINLAAFQNIGGKAVIINTLCTKKPSDVTVFLKYDHDVHNPVGNHYIAIVLMPEKVLEEVSMADENINHYEQPPPPPTESAGPSNTINIAINPNIRNHQKKRKCNRLDKFLLAETLVEMVNEISWDIDGDITYQMKSDADFWINDTHNGRWWHTVDSKQKGFTDVMKGERKFATCHGSYVCNNNECTKWLTEKVRNRIDFRQAKGGGYTCKSWGYYVKREHSGALKAIEFEYSSQTVTVKHQGRHKCQLKPDCKSQLEYAQEQTLNRDLRKSPRELMIDLIGYYLAQGDIEKAKEVAEKMDDYRVIEKL